MLLTIDEASYILNKTRRHCYGLLACGKLVGLKVTPIKNSEHGSWRIPEESILWYAAQSPEYRREEVAERMRKLQAFLEAAGVQWYEG